MKVVNRVLFSELAGFSLGIDLAQLGARGVIVGINVWAQATELELSGINSGQGVQHWRGTPVVSPGNGLHFGGPLFGDTFSANTGAMAALAQGEFIFVDEPIRPFGQMSIRTFNEAGIAPAGTSASFNCPSYSTWIQSVSLLAISDMPITGLLDLSEGLFEATATPIISAAANAPGLFGPMAQHTAMAVAFVNGGGAAAEVWAEWRAVLG